MNIIKVEKYKYQNTRSNPVHPFPLRYRSHSSWSAVIFSSTSLASLNSRSTCVLSDPTSSLCLISICSICSFSLMFSNLSWLFYSSRWPTNAERVAADWICS